MPNEPSASHLARFIKPLNPAERLALQQEHEKLLKERQLRELARGEAEKRPVGRPRGSKNKPPPLTAPSAPSSGSCGPSTQSE